MSRIPYKEQFIYGWYTRYFYKTFPTKSILLILVLCNISLGLIKQKCYYEVDHELIEDSCWALRLIMCNSV